MSANHMKQIREIYGATQDEIAKAADVNRSTVSQWETGSIKASRTKRERLSIFYGIGPESFYDVEEIGEERRQILIEMSKKEREIKEQSGVERNKAEELSQLLSGVDFDEAMSKFMFSMKVMLASTDKGSLEDLQIALEISKKMTTRLQSIVDIRIEEEADGQDLFSIWDTHANSQN